MEAFSARMLVCSAMSLISSTMLPISCELSPRRLMRLEVSWIVSRMAFMPSMVRRTASPPLCATSTEWRATSAARSALPETSSMEPPWRRWTRWPRRSAATARCSTWRGAAALRLRLPLVAPSSWIADWLMVDEAAELIRRHVDRVGDRAGDVLGDGGRGRQVALREAGDLIEQPQDRLLVAFVLEALVVGRAQLAVADDRLARSVANSRPSGTSAPSAHSRRPSPAAAGLARTAQTAAATSRQQRRGSR
jgi:hypothetical protein